MKNYTVEITITKTIEVEAENEETALKYAYENESAYEADSLEAKVISESDNCDRLGTAEVFEIYTVLVEIQAQLENPEPEYDIRSLEEEKSRLRRLLRENGHDPDALLL